MATSDDAREARKRIDDYFATRDMEYADTVILASLERELSCRTCGFFHMELTCPRWVFE